MSVGFSILFGPDGGATFRLSRPEGGAARAALVTWARDERSQTAAALLGRLYYQDELRAWLPGSPRGEPAADAALALAAYRQADLAGLRRLEGEFALLVWDGKRRRLLAHRDPFGSYPLFWTAGSAGVGVGTSLEELVRLQPGRSFDLEYLAEFLMRPSPVSEVSGERTAFAGVQRVPAGTTVELRADGAVGRHRYWDWASRIEPATVTTLDEAGERFGHLLRQAVAQRIRRGPVAAHLSGGMDSSAVVALAREGLARGAGPSTLFTLSLVYDRPSLAGERAYADLVVRQGGPLQAHYLQADAALDYQWFERSIPYHEEPYGGLAGLAMEQLLLDGAERVGAATVLTGLGSDEILEPGPYQIADLLRRGRWVAALKEVVRWSGAWNTGFWSVLRDHGLEPLWPVLMREGLRAAWGGSGRWPHLGRFTVPPWVPAEFAGRHAMRRHGAAYARRCYGRPAARSTALQAIETFVGDPCHWYFAAPRGIHLAHPFRDPRLICFGLGIPARLKMIPGRRKPVLQEAMRGVLPDPIRTRREKRGFNDVYWRGLARNLTRLEGMARASGLCELGVLDAAKLVEAMRQAALGVGDLNACERIDKTLALVAWFEQAERPRPPAEPPEVHPLGASPPRPAPRAATSC